MERYGQGIPPPDMGSRAGMPDWTCVLGAAALGIAAVCTEGDAQRNLRWFPELTDLGL